MTTPMQPSDTFTDLDALLAEADWVRRLARSLLRDEWAALDLSQDVLHDAIQAPPALRGKRLRAWLGTVTRRKMFRKLERENNRGDIEREAARSEVIESDAASQRVQLHMDLGKEIQALQPEDRSVIVAFFLEGRSQQEMADEAGVSPASMRKRVSRAKARLAEKLAASPRGRDGWSAAFLAIATESLPPFAPGIAPLTSSAFGVFPFAAIMMKIALSLAVVVAATLAVFRFPSPDSAPARDLLSGLGDRSLSSSVEHEDDGVELVSPTLAAEGTRQLGVVVDGSTRLGGLHVSRFVVITNEAGEPLPDARAVWLGSLGELQEVAVDEEGRLKLPSASEGRLFATASGRLGRCVEFDTELGDAEPGTDRSVVLLTSRAIVGRATIDGVAPGRELTLREALFPADLGLSQGESSLEEQLLALLGIDTGRSLWIDGNGAFSFLPNWELDEYEFGLPREFLLRSVDGEESEDGQSDVVFARTEQMHSVDFIQLPAVRGRLIWSDDRSPVTGHVDFVLHHGDKGQLTSANLGDDGAFAVASLLDSHRLEPRSLDLEALTWNQQPIRVADRLIIGLSAHGLGVVHEVSLDRPGSTIELGDVVVQRDQEVQVLVRGLAENATGLGDPTPIEAVVRGSNGARNSDAHGLVTVRISHGKSLEAIAVGYRYREIFPSQGEIDLGEPIVIDLEPAPTLEILTPLDPEAQRLGTATQVRLAFDWTPFDTADLDDENRGSPYDLGLQRALQDGRFLGGGWSHTSPGSGGTVNLATDSSGRSIVAGLAPESTFRVELVDCLNQVVMSTNIDNLPSDLSLIHI